MSTAIKLAQLTKIYAKRGRAPLHAVAAVDLTIPAGQVIGLLGPNGAGKTTTIKMICGLVEPTSGQVTLNGFDVRHQRRMAMQQVGAVLEGTRNIYWRLSAWQNLLYFGRLKGVFGHALRQRAEALLKDLDLWERRGDEVKEFSRGMQQKVAIACALIADPPIVLLDEPTLGLDVHAARTVKEWVKQLAHSQGKTIVLTTHQLDMAEELCERVVIIRQGQTVADEPTAALLDLFRQEHYEVQVAGHWDHAAIGITEPPLTDFVLHHRDGHTQLTGQMAEAKELYQLLDKLHGCGATLLAVKRAQPTLEDVFIQLTQQHEERAA